MSQSNTAYPWRYRCSLCGELFRSEDVAGHSEDEKAKPTWPGFTSWKREDPKRPEER